MLWGVQDVEDVLVLICGHGGRDMRCGTMGPVLRDEFEEKLGQKGFVVAKGPVQVGTTDASRLQGQTAKGNVARVGLISHIGGHKFAGNVIIYLPPGMKGADGTAHPLAGHGLWYGRVEPQHVEGLVDETVMRGNVVADMFRGAIDSQRRILRL